MPDPRTVPCTEAELAQLIEHSGPERVLSMGWPSGGIYAVPSNQWALNLLGEWRKEAPDA